MREGVKRRRITQRVERRANCANSEEGERRAVEEYRGVTLMPSLYKIYTTILARRLEDKVEEKVMIPQN